MRCCICKQEYHGWSNNPYGALNEDYKPINWKADDGCCDECNKRYVIPGRLYLKKQENSHK